MNGVPGLSDQFRAHFGHRDHLYGVLLDELAADLDAGGPTADICVDHLGAERGDAIQLRLLAGIFRIVLRGEAPEMEPYYPSLGGPADPSGAWTVLRPLLYRHVTELRGALDLAPQTNEVGRAACLAIGMFAAVREHGLRRVRLLELGASGGLNLNVDRFRVIGPGWAWGPQRSPLSLDTEAAGARPEELTVVRRRGCDVSPVDVSTRSGAAYLTSFVWPFDLERHRRLAAAITLARIYPVTVDRAPASAWIARELAGAPTDGVLTVVWQSITEQYWPAAESDAVSAAIDDARARMPLARIRMEGIPPVQAIGGYRIAERGPATTLDGVVLARSHHHGPPVLLTGDRTG